MNYFEANKTVEDIKAKYRRLALHYHPDQGGDEEKMKAINQEYHEALKRSHGATTQGSDGKEHTYYYNATTEQAVIDKLNELIRMALPDTRIMLVGTWLWVDGNTKPVREKLKDAGLQWHTEREKWYWHQGKYRRGKSAADFGTIVAKYGYEEFEPEKRKQLGKTA
jgi:anaerobic glycerol-3-phosphate dehydrogenase